MGLSAVGQSFTMTGNKSLGKVKFYIQKTGMPIGKLVVRLYKGVLDGFGRIIPDDNPVNSGELAFSSLLDFANIDNLYGWEEFTFSDSQQYSLENSQIYVLQIEIYEGSNINAGNNIHVWGTLDPTCCTGNESGYDSAWKSYNFDVSMRVYDVDDNLIYECNQAGCGGGYGYDVLKEIHPYAELVDVEEEEQQQYTTDITKEWVYDYDFKYESLEMIRADLISRIEETKSVKSNLVIQKFTKLFKIIGKVGNRFEESLKINCKEVLIPISFSETINISASLGIAFEEVRPTSITWTFTLIAYAKIIGETISKEKEFLDELEWL